MQEPTVNEAVDEAEDNILKTKCIPHRLDLQKLLKYSLENVCATTLKIYGASIYKGIDLSDNEQLVLFLKHSTVNIWSTGEFDFFTFETNVQPRCFMRHIISKSQQFKETSHRRTFSY